MPKYEGRNVANDDKAERLFVRGTDIWVRMESGEEIQLGPIDQVETSMRQFLEQAPKNHVPLNKVR